MIEGCNIDGCKTFDIFLKSTRIYKIFMNYEISDFGFNLFYTYFHICSHANFRVRLCEVKAKGATQRLEIGENIQCSEEKRIT